MGKFNIAIDIPEPLDGEEDATDRQIQYIRALMRETGASGFPEQALREIGRWQASSIIEQLLDAKKQLKGDAPLDPDLIMDLEEKPASQAWFAKLAFIALAVIVILWLTTLV